MLALRRRPGTRAHPAPDPPRRETLGDPKRQRHSHRKTAVEHPVQHRPRGDRHDRLAAAAAVPPKPDRQLLRRRTRSHGPQNHALTEPVPNESNCCAGTGAQRPAGRAATWSCCVHRGRLLRPELDVAIKVDDSLRALLLDKFRSTTGIIWQDGPRRPFCGPETADAPPPERAPLRRSRPDGPEIGDADLRDGHPTAITLLERNRARSSHWA